MTTKDLETTKYEHKESFVDLLTRWRSKEVKMSNRPAKKDQVCKITKNMQPYTFKGFDFSLSPPLSNYFMWVLSLRIPLGMELSKERIKTAGIRSQRGPFIINHRLSMPSHHSQYWINQRHHSKTLLIPWVIKNKEGKSHMGSSLI